MANIKWTYGKPDRVGTHLGSYRGVEITAVLSIANGCYVTYLGGRGFAEIIPQRSLAKAKVSLAAVLRSAKDDIDQMLENPDLFSAARAEAEKKVSEQESAPRAQNF